jgi:hypothetical protein
MHLNDVAALLEPEPLPLETGYERLPDGVLHVAVRTDLHECSGEMLEWWFRWRCDTQKYIWWHPVDHMFSTWQGELSAATHVGSEHVVTEEFTGQPAADLVIQFRDPAEFFDRATYLQARDSGKISCAVTGRIGFSHHPDRKPDGAIIGGRLLHVGRDTPWGLALRSHFYVGQDLPESGASPLDVEREITREFGVGLLQHAYNEFTFLSRFLPSLYLAEHRDKQRPTVPW